MDMRQTVRELVAKDAKPREALVIVAANAAEKSARWTLRALEKEAAVQAYIASVGGWEKAHTTERVRISSMTLEARGAAIEAAAFAKFLAACFEELAQ